MAKGSTTKKIIGGLEIAIGAGTGNPMLMAQGAGTMAGGFAENGKQGGEGGAPAAAPLAPTVPPTQEGWSPIDRSRNDAAKAQWTAEDQDT